MVDRDAVLRREMRGYLDTLVITSDNIGDIRRSLFMPWDSAWNGWVRDETAARENRAVLTESATSHPARLTDSETGKAIGSADHIAQLTSTLAEQAQEIARLRSALAGLVGKEGAEQ